MSLRDFDLFPAVLDLAARSCALRAMEAIGLRPDTDTDPRRQSEWFQLNDAILQDMAQLGRACRETGGDPRGSSLWKLVNHGWRFEQAFERMRRVSVLRADLTPKFIYDRLRAGNVIDYDGHALVVGGPREGTDAYGLPCYVTPVTLKWSDGKKSEWADLSPSVARSIYADLTGFSYVGPHDAGDDPRHMYDPDPSYLDDEEENAGVAVLSERKVFAVTAVANMAPTYNVGSSTVEVFKDGSPCVVGAVYEPPDDPLLYTYAIKTAQGRFLGFDVRSLPDWKRLTSGPEFPSSKRCESIAKALVRRYQSWPEFVDVLVTAVPDLRHHF